MTRSIFFILLISVKSNDQPNIIFVLADDLGWSDVTWNNRNVETTPFLSSLRKRGTILTQSYSSHRCTPSRAQLLTGRYAFRYGLGSDPISKANPVGLTPNEKLLPSYLKEVGYETHAVGKWHLGYCNASFQPHHRGFDTFYGHYAGSMNYFTHTLGSMYTKYLNHYTNDDPFLNATYLYSTYDFGLHARQKLQENPDSPKFIYLAFNAPHEPVSAPEDLIEKFREKYPESPISRLEYLAAVHAMDLELEKIVKSAKNLERETIIIFQSDNGGSLLSYGTGNEEGERACNYPYRGYKNTLYEGGTLSPTMIYSTKQKMKNRIVRTQFHIIDWLPTILDFAKYGKKLPKNLDGVNQRVVFSERSGSYAPPRTSFIYGVVNEYNTNREEWNTMFTVRYGKYKYSNFVRNSITNYECKEGFSNRQLIDSLSLQTRKAGNGKDWKEYRQLLRETSEPPLNRKSKDNRPVPGHSLFDLDTDPFEIRDLNLEGKLEKLGSKEKSHFEILMTNITEFVHSELRKGFEYPITGKLRNGNLLKTIISHAFDFNSRLDFMLTTGRLLKFANVKPKSSKRDKKTTSITGVVGNHFCPAHFDDHILKELYIEALFSENQKLAFCIKLYLNDLKAKSSIK